MITLKFDFPALSVNALYSNIPGQARRFTSAKGRAFKAKVAEYVREQIKNEEVEALVGKPLTLFADFGLADWLLKDGVSVRKKDLENLTKALVDSIFEILSQINEEMDDCYIWHLDIAKRVTQEPNILIEIKEYTSPL